MKKSISILLNLAVAFSMLLTLFAVQPGVNSAKADDPGEPQAPAPIIQPRQDADIQLIEEISKEAALEKIDPALREIAQGGSKDVIDIFVSIGSGGADLEAFLTDVIERPSVFKGMITFFGRINAANLLKLAMQPGVISIADAGLKELEPPVAKDLGSSPDQAALLARMDALRANELTWAEAQAQASDVGAQGWFDVLDGHKSAEAWKKGFDGTGVIIGVIDDGIDFGHPDLQGTYAWVTDEDSPYYGWPMAFSQASTQYFANDVFAGTSFIADGATSSRWSDTQETFEFSTPFGGGMGTYWYMPLGASAYYEYSFALTSASGFYKIGSFPEMNLANLYGHRVAVLVVDEHSSGNYDTVYVDLDNDKDFSDEKPATMHSPEIYRDMDGDGYADISGGLLAWISDGANTPPVADWLWGVTCSDSSKTMKGCPDSGELLIFAGSFRAGYTHGTQCASNVAGQGVVNGGLTAQPFRVGGMVQGAAPNVGLMDFGDFYVTFFDEDHYMVAALGYDGLVNSGDEIQVTSNSYGAFRQMWGSWGYTGRLLTAINLTIGPNTTYIFSSGNEGPGYGPQEGDSSPTTIQAGSSTQYGSTNWDSIFSPDQIMYGDPNSFFSKGPNRDGSSGLDVLANGGRGAGDEGINYYGFNGAESWATWGGTSRSAPVAAGNLALVYQAYKARYGEWPTWEMAKALLKSGATNSVSSPFFQGAGVVNADRATDLAAGIYGVYATPDEWQVGDWEGAEYLNFARVAMPGGTYTKTYSVYNPSGYDITVDLSDGVMSLMSRDVISFTTSHWNEESSFNFHAPDYLAPIDPAMIPADAELMVVRYVHPYDTFDPVYDFTDSPNSSWRFMVYNWTDVNGDGMLWDDANGNGAVNHVDNLALGPDNDGFLRPDFSSPDTEIQEGEYVRVDYEFGGLAVPVAIRDPLARMADGYFFGLQHRRNDFTVDQTTFTMAVEFYKRADFAWLALSDASLTVPAESMGTFDAVASIPASAAPGTYEAVIYMHDPGDAHHMAHESALPVVVNVIADLPDDGAVTLGGGMMEPTLYQNSYTYGYFNWYGGGWTGAGDWRHYFLNIDDADLENANLLIHTSWDSGYPTDINTWLLGPTYDCASNGVGCGWPYPSLGAPWPSVFGPYTLQPIASSEPFRAGATYPFNTSTGGPDDWVKAPLSMAGLHEIALHNVLYDGEKLASQFTVEVGTIDLEATMPVTTGVVTVGSVDAEVYTDTGAIDLWFSPTIEIPDLNATLSGGLQTDFFGWFTAFIPDTGACFSAWCAGNVYEPFIVNQAGATELYLFLDVPGGQDIDMFLVYDSDNNGVAQQGIDAVVGSSGNSAGADEFITVANPALGRYFAVFDGYDVTPDTGVNADWYYEVTAPGPLPTETLDVYDDVVTVTQDSMFDPTTASYSMTVTTNERASALHVLLSGIPSGNDIDVYVSDSSGILVQSQTLGNGNEHIIILPSSGYRFGAGHDFTIWVHGYNVPAGPVYPNLHVWWDALNVWLSAVHPDVYVDAIGAGETVSVTLHYEKLGMMVGDFLSARLTAGPSGLEDAFDELVTITRADPPAAPVWDPNNLAVDYTVESARGPSAFIPLTIGGVGVDTDLVRGDEEMVFTMDVRNDDPTFTSDPLELWAEIDNISQNLLFGHLYQTPAFNGWVITPTVGSYGYDPANWIIGTQVVTWTGTLAPGEGFTMSWSLTMDTDMAPGAPGALDRYFSFVYDPIYWWIGPGYAWDGLEGVAGYSRTFRTTGSAKYSSMSEIDVVAPGETFTYTLSLANPSAEDREVMVVDTLPDEVDFVSAPSGMTYDPATHQLTWTGWLYGSATPMDVPVTVMAKSDTPEGIFITNMATIYRKFFGLPYATFYDDSYVDDGMDPELVIEKTVDQLMGTHGDLLMYTITLENVGTETAAGAMIHDMVPSMLDVDEASITGGATYMDGAIHWSGDLNPGASVTVTFEATINTTATEGYALINAAEAWADNYWTVFNSALTEIFKLKYIFLPILSR